MNSDIHKFRRFVLTLISILFFGLAFNSVASGEVKVVNTKYKVELTGLHVHDWHSQSEGYPESDRVWNTERGTITSGFRTVKGIVHKGTKFVGKAPTGVDLPKFHRIAGLRPGQTQTWKGSKEAGEVSLPINGFTPKPLKKCPPMSGFGTQHCWITEMTLELTRIK